MKKLIIASMLIVGITLGGSFVIPKSNSLNNEVIPVSSGTCITVDLQSCPKPVLTPAPATVNNLPMTNTPDPVPAQPAPESSDPTPQPDTQTVTAPQTDSTPYVPNITPFNSQ